MSNAPHTIAYIAGERAAQDGAGSMRGLVCVYPEGSRDRAQWEAGFRSAQREADHTYEGGAYGICRRCGGERH